MRWSGFLSAAVSMMLACSMAAPADAAAMSCAGAMVVDGYVLTGISIEGLPGRLPRRGAPLRGIEPACDPEEDDRGVRVTALAGMPVRLAVAPERDDTTVYVAEGSLVALASHPLHSAWFADARRPSLRRGQPCMKTASITGTVSHPGDFTSLRLATPDGERTVRVDARSRITNRPAYQPVLQGQRLSVRMVKCGRHRVADQIRFMGATVRPKRHEIGLDGDGGLAWPLLLVPAAIVLFSIPLIRKI